MASPDEPQSQEITSDHAMADSDTIISAWNLTRDQQQQQSQPQPQREKQSKTPRRVCTACRRRKVGCDKKQPCQHCKKSGNDCVYPLDNNNSTDEQQIFRDTRLLEQLYRLEPMFKTLASGAEQGTLPAVVGSIQPHSTNNSQSSPTPPTPPHSVGSGSTNNRPANRPEGDQQTTTQQIPSPSPLVQQQLPSQDTDLTGTGTGTGRQSNASNDKRTLGSSWSPFTTSTGKLVKDDGRQRYVSGTFWESLHTEVTSHLKPCLDNC